MEKGNIKENRHLVDLVIQQVLAFKYPLTSCTNYLKHSKGGRRPTERSVFKIIFVKLAEKTNLLEHLQNKGHEYPDELCV